MSERLKAIKLHNLQKQYYIKRANAITLHNDYITAIRYNINSMC
jgi:hypothetical protein